jgi:hypothetical protein
MPVIGTKYEPSMVLISISELNGPTVWDLIPKMHFTIRPAATVTGSGKLNLVCESGELSLLKNSASISTSPEFLRARVR